MDAATYADPDALAAGYRAHIETLTARHDHALEKAGASHAVIFSGAPRLKFLDDFDRMLRSLAEQSRIQSVRCRNRLANGFGSTCGPRVAQKSFGLVDFRPAVASAREAMKPIVASARQVTEVVGMTERAWREVVYVMDTCPAKVVGAADQCATDVIALSSDTAEHC